MAYSALSGALLRATCANLFNYPDKPPPEGLVAEPEVASGYPRPSDNGRTLTFVIRPGFQFNTGAPLKADAFVRAINRVLSPAMQSPGVKYVQEIVGAQDVLSGKSDTASGVRARGNKLIIRFTRPVRDFPARTTMGFFCAVPPRLPVPPEGVGAYPSAGPYYVDEYVRGQRVVMKRNRYYGGKRPHHVEKFVVHLMTGDYGDVLETVARRQADWAFAPAPGEYLDRSRGLVEKYDVNKSQFWVKPGLSLAYFALNTSRGVFQKNPRLRRAVNFAVDRKALREVVGGPLFGTLADRYLPAGFPNVHQGRIYVPPNVRRANALAQGHLNGGKAVLYIPNIPGLILQALAFKQSVEKIGLKIEIEPIPPGPGYYERIGKRNEPFDIAWGGWTPDYVDPAAYLNALLDGRLLKAEHNDNVSYFDSPLYNRLLARAARSQGKARYRAYAKLDLRIARDAAPMVAYRFISELTLVSKRAGCIVLRPQLDLAAVCLE